MRKCMSEGCDDNATKQGEIVVYAHANHQPAIAKMELYVCNCCAMAEPASILISTDEGRESIESMFAAQGLILPDWNLSYAHWVNIYDA